MKKIIVFGASESSISFVRKFEAEGKTLVAWTDNDEKKWGKSLYDCPIIPPARIKETDFDTIIILSISGYKSICKQLIDLGVPNHKIDKDTLYLNIFARERFVSDLAGVFRKCKMQGAVAEGGVYQGDFSSILNQVFSEKKLYLFDTFEGFDERDVKIEEDCSFSNAVAGHLNNTSIEIVKEKLSFVENVQFVKGYFPESAENINDVFCYVNIDFDLYKPTKSALEFFWPKMIEGGIITVHDYFSSGYDGINQCVDDFCKMVGRVPFPIGDGISIAIQK